MSRAPDNKTFAKKVEQSDIFLTLQDLGDKIFVIKLLKLLYLHRGRIDNASSNHVQNMIENIILTSYSDKS